MNEELKWLLYDQGKVIRDLRYTVQSLSAAVNRFEKSKHMFGDFTWTGLEELKAAVDRTNSYMESLEKIAKEIRDKA